MRWFRWWKIKRIKLPDETKDVRLAEQKLQESERKLDDAIKTKREVQIVSDQFAKSLERAMRRTHG